MAEIEKLSPIAPVLPAVKRREEQQEKPQQEHGKQQRQQQDSDAGDEHRVDEYA